MILFFFICYSQGASHWFLSTTYSTTSFVMVKHNMKSSRFDIWVYSAVWTLCGSRDRENLRHCGLAWVKVSALWKAALHLALALAFGYIILFICPVCSLQTRYISRFIHNLSFCSWQISLSIHLLCITGHCLYKSWVIRHWVIRYVCTTLSLLTL